MHSPPTYHNPFNGEYTRILRSAADTGGEYSLLEVNLMPGGGNPLHYHTCFSEEFIAVQGSLGLQYESAVLHLAPGETRLVPIGVEHRFFNDGAEPIMFRIMLRTGQPGFENFIKVLFGLVNDGRTTRSQVPKNPFHAALLLKWGDTHLKNPFFWFFSPLASFAAGIATRSGIAGKLLRQYA